MPLATVKKGDRNQYVMLLQRFLVLNSLLVRDASGADPVSGLFDDATKDALILFKESNGFSRPPNPDAGGATWGAIAGVANDLETVGSVPDDEPLTELHPGDVDPLVTVMQRLLMEFAEPVFGFLPRGIITKDDVVSSGGVFGEKTEKAVKAFQTNRGLAPADGIVGPATWETLIFPKGRSPIPPVSR
jgi:hypothetical protein